MVLLSELKKRKNSTLKEISKKLLLQASKHIIEVAILAIHSDQHYINSTQMFAKNKI